MFVALRTVDSLSQENQSMNGMVATRSRQLSQRESKFDGTPMQWLSGAMDVRQQSRFQFLRLAIDEIRVVKQASVTLAAMRFIAFQSRHYFAGAERISEITHQSTKTIYKHWETLEKVGMIFRRRSSRVTEEFRLSKEAEESCVMLPIDFIGRLGTFSEQILFSIVLANTWKLLAIEDLALVDSCINFGLTSYLTVSKGKWEDSTNLNVAQLFRAKASLLESELITAHGKLRNVLLPSGKHEDVDLLRSVLDEKG